MSFDLNFHLHRLLKNEPFFAAFSRKVEKVADDSIPTAAIAYNRETQRFVLLYNPDFMESLSDEHKVGVLKHEFYHLILKHLTARLPFDSAKEPEKMKTWNVAADLSINTHLVDELPKMACIPGYGPFKDYIAGCTAEAYFKKLMEDKQSQQGPFQPDKNGEPGDPESMDDHSSWGDVGDPDGMDAQVAQEKLKEMTKDAVEASEKHSKHWGSVPHSVRQEIRKMVAPTISPEAVLRYFIKTSTKSNRTSTIRRINPRYPYIHPGRRAKRVANIAISIDQSGSVDDQMLQTFFSFLNKFASIATFTVVPFDSTVCEEAIYVWKKGETRKWHRVRYGGTCFNAPTEWVNKRSFDGHIVITDMQAPKPIASKCQRLWITNSYNKRYQWFQTNEKVLAIDA
jgi:predicted metal-dependent peptidase